MANLQLVMDTREGTDQNTKIPELEIPMRAYKIYDWFNGKFIPVAGQRLFDEYSDAKAAFETLPLEQQAQSSILRFGLVFVKDHEVAIIHHVDQANNRQSMELMGDPNMCEEVYKTFLDSGSTTGATIWEQNEQICP